MVPFPAASAELTLSVDAAGRAPLEVGGVGAKASAPLEALEVPFPGARDTCLGATAEGATQSAAHEAEASEAEAGHHEAEPEGSPQPSPPKVVSSGASPAAPCAGCHIQRFGWLRLDFDALRRRKGSPSLSL